MGKISFRARTRVVKCQANDRAIEPPLECHSSTLGRKLIFLIERASGEGCSTGVP
jgi:hypothetical protein